MNNKKQINTNSNNKHSGRQRSNNRTEFLSQLCLHFSNWNKLKTSFNKLLNKSVQGDWGALESRLQPQNFTLVAPRKNRFKFAYAVASFVLLLSLVAVTASTALNSSDAKLLPTSGDDKNASMTSSASKQSVAAGSAKKQSSSAKTVSAVKLIVPSIKLPMRTGDKNTSMTSSTSKQSVAAGSAKKQSSSAKTVSAVKLIVPSMKLPMMPDEPQFLDYNHKLYITNTVFAAKETASQQDLIGHISLGTSVPVFSVKDVDTTKSICLLSTYEQSDSSSSSSYSYLNYNYLCDDSFTLQNNTYHLIARDDSSFLDVTPAHIIKNPKENYDTKNDYFVKWDFQCQFSTVLKSVKAILGNEIGKLPSGGTVYKIDEIDLSEAVYVNIGKNWFLITKADGYSGKTVSDVMKDKGIDRAMF